MKFIWFLIKIGVLTFLGILLFIVFKENTIKTPKNYDSILVLGAQVKEDGSLSYQLQLRLEKAMEVYKKKNCLIITSGAKGLNEPTSEGIAMKNWLVQNNIPENHIVYEIDSYTTRENIENAIKILDSYNLKNPVIITSDYHLPRALSIAKDLGLVAQGFPSPTLPEYWFKNHSREVLSWVKYLLEKVIK